MPTFTINGNELTVPPGTTVLQAALAEGIDIPHYCYHDGLSIAGNCRICLVEIEGFGKPAIACNTPAADGMVVHTESEKVKEWREAVMEFLLINHPLDCPICDQAGECKLQDYSYRHGTPTTRFKEEKEHGPKRRDFGPHVVFDWERCIKCTRCIRFCEEVTETAELGMFLRGVREEIGVFPGKPLTNAYSGNVVDICPVGALTLKEARFKARVWFVTNAPTTCPGCARGCSIDLGVFRNEVHRITPRENHAVNRWWICDEGRLWGERMIAGYDSRLRALRGVEEVPGLGQGWESAIDQGARALEQAAAAGSLAVLASSRATVEQAWMLAKLVSGPLRGARVFLPQHERGEDDDLLIRKDKTPNRKGVEAVFEGMGIDLLPVPELEKWLGEAAVSAVLALGPGLVGPVDDEPAPVSDELLARAGQLIVIDAHRSPLSDAASLLLPATAYAESPGTYVSFAGRVQHVERALVPQSNVRPPAMILSDLFGRLTGETPPAPAEMRRRVSQDVDAFGHIDWENLPGSAGQDLKGHDAASRACKPTGAAVDMIKSGFKD
jgi:NADH-quinone oxidoreductase subunit G